MQNLLNLKGPLLIFGIALYFYFLGGRLDDAPTPGQLGPYFWPRSILILLMVSCGIKSLEILSPRKEAAGRAETDPLPSPIQISKLVALIAAVIGVVFSMDKIGFLLANFFFLLFFLALTGLRRAFPLLLLSAGGTVALLYLFVKVVYLPLPKGMGFFEDVTLFLYRLLGVI
ncbi:MAG: tripartite tricarboxylate transporter TctB family protein [Syntrophaceae bacterium]|nr:tripartite tricarboxylate transporter TctB family protein [Syntrophaceae bacterium]